MWNKNEIKYGMATKQLKVFFYCTYKLKIIVVHKIILLLFLTNCAASPRWWTSHFSEGELKLFCSGSKLKIIALALSMDSAIKSLQISLQYKNVHCIHILLKNQVSMSMSVSVIYLTIVHII